MKTVMHHSLYALIAALLVSGLCQAVTSAAGLALPRHVPAALLLLLGCGGLFAALLATLFLRMRREDHSVNHEAQLCREQSARTQADQALAEADLLLARINARASIGANDAAGQVLAIQAELCQIQQRCASDRVTRARLELLRMRIERLAYTLRGDPRTLEPG